MRFPVLEGDVGSLRRGLRRRPFPPGLHERPLQPEPGLQFDEEGTSFFTYGDSGQPEIPSDTKVGDSCQEEGPSQCEGVEQSEESSEKNCVFSFHTNPRHSFLENSAPTTVCILDLGCARAMGSRKAVMHSADMWTHIDFGMRFILQVQDFSLRTLNNRNVLRRLLSSCTIMDGISHFTEFDIVEEGDVPLLTSLPQMRNLGSQFELTPEKAYLSCARIGMRKMVLKTAISTHRILDLQDIA